MKLLQINNLSKYGRKMMIDGMIIEVNIGELNEVSRQISLIGNNINQVVKRINSNGKYDKEDGVLLRKKLDEIWKLVRKIYSNIMKRYKI